MHDTPWRPHLRNAPMDVLSWRHAAIRLVAAFLVVGEAARLGEDADSQGGRFAGLPPGLDPPKECVKQMAAQGAKMAKTSMEMCLSQASAPVPPTASIKDKCSCIDDAIDETQEAYSNANCRKIAKKEGIRPLKRMRKKYGCPETPHCDEDKADEEHDACMDKLKKCLSKHGIDFDVVYLKELQQAQIDSQPSTALGRGVSSLAQFAELRQNRSIGHGSYDDEDGDDDDDEGNKICKCGDDALKCVKLAALTANCKEMEEDFHDEMKPQRDNICRRHRPNDEPVGEGVGNDGCD
eukprot:TRINITY_DN28419_c0_g1_i1.p1 TRINITY_DN28419_c0_g1~~TRINITY_DN28419_c0_g1_i1.p1  ORF type:complete len:294 (-),score=72.91 TRINITY_DN28419_c0_g1_i1:52-933(-)